MTNIQAKSIQHISKTLKSFDTYEIYKALSDAIEKEGIEDNIRTNILIVFEGCVKQEKAKIIEAKEWIDLLISDLQK